MFVSIQKWLWVIQSLIFGNCASSIFPCGNSQWIIIHSYHQIIKKEHAEISYNYRCFVIWPNPVESLQIPKTEWVYITADSRMTKFRTKEMLVSLAKQLINYKDRNLFTVQWTSLDIYTLVLYITYIKLQFTLQNLPILLIVIF